MQRKKLFKCFVSLQFLQTKKKIDINLHQKELLGCFYEDIKMCSSQKVLNFYTSN